MEVTDTLTTDKLHLNIEYARQINFGVMQCLDNPVGQFVNTWKKQRVFKERTAAAAAAAAAPAAAANSHYTFIPKISVSFSFRRP